MNLKQLDLTSLEKAIASLNEAVTEYSKQPTNKFIRDAAIQRFEYTYELSHKMLKRFLDLTEPSAEEIEQMGFADLIRTASERGLLTQGWDVWKNYRHARNATSHTYNEKKADEVYSIIPPFLIESKNLLSTLQKRIAQD
jgi:nucleotidyltransferase substrate binding protein (TIGR01987 family)